MFASLEVEFLSEVVNRLFQIHILIKPVRDYMSSAPPAFRPFGIRDKGNATLPIQASEYSSICFSSSSRRRFDFCSSVRWS